MEKRNYYTYREILFGLRVEYQKNQKLLEELKKMVEVLSSKEYDFTLRIKQGYKYYPNDDFPALLLRVTKKQGKLEKAITDIENKVSFDYARWRKSNAEFVYKEEDRYPGFYAHNYMNGTKYFHPSVIINDEKGFHEIYKEIQKSKLFQLPESTIVINNFQDMDIQGHKISLNTLEELKISDADISITYRADDDKVHLKQNYRHNYIYLDALLNTQVPSYLIPEEYINIIERNLRPDFINKHLDEYEFDKEDTIPLFDKPKVYTKN